MLGCPLDVRMVAAGHPPRGSYRRSRGNPVVAIDWPRPDFRVAALEFLIGLLATACPPRDAEAWLDWWQAPLA
jgi:CRISPR system Cascade subunit CasA